MVLSLNMYLSGKYSGGQCEIWINVGELYQSNTSAFLFFFMQSDTNSDNAEWGGNVKFLSAIKMSQNRWIPVAV